MFEASADWVAHDSKVGVWLSRTDGRYHKLDIEMKRLPSLGLHLDEKLGRHVFESRSHGTRISRSGSLLQTLFQLVHKRLVLERVHKVFVVPQGGQHSHAILKMSFILTT